MQLTTVRNSATRRERSKIALLALTFLVLIGCGADEEATDDPIAVDVTPAITPAFDKKTQDYVINCATTPTIQLAVTNPRSTHFVYLGTTRQPAATATTDPQFQQSLSLLPGERFQFVIGAGATYSVRCLPPDFPALTATRTGTPQAQWYVFAPTFLASSSYVIITDANGTPVWWKDAPGSAGDAKIVAPNEIAWTISGSGEYVISNFSGQVVDILSGNLDGHELQPTAAGTFLVIRNIYRICPPDCADLSPWGGSAQAPVIDAQILEMDRSGNVLWTWNTRDHIALSETTGTGWYPSVGADLIHMNAIEPDGANGLIFSARHLNAIYHITKSTGAIDWKIGGTQRPESLTVVGDPRPNTSGPGGQALSGQHDARRWADQTISVHDNGTIANRPPAVVRYRLDLATRTATVVEVVQDSRATSSYCCGSSRLLPGGNWLVQWGAAPFMTELDPTGQPALTIQYNQGPGFSYRAVPVLSGEIPDYLLRGGMDAMARTGP